MYENKTVEVDWRKYIETLLTLCLRSYGLTIGLKGSPAVVFLYDSHKQII